MCTGILALVAVRGGIPYVGNLVPATFDASHSERTPVGGEIVIDILQTGRLVPSPVVTPISMIPDAWMLGVVTDAGGGVGRKVLVFYPLLLGVGRIAETGKVVRGTHIDFVIITAFETSSPCTTPTPAARLMSYVTVTTRIPGSY